MNAPSRIASDWIAPLFSGVGDAPVAMICFPPAGGGAVGFRPWAEPMRAHADVYAATLPGREHRLREEPARAIDALAAPLVTAIAALAGRPLLVFGHSFGALVAYEVVHRLLAEGGAANSLHFVASGRVAPHLGSRTPPLAHLPAREIVFRVAKLHGNIPVALLEEPDYVAMIGNVLQADLQIHEQYAWPQWKPLPCGLTVVGGTADPVVSHEELEAWERLAGGGFSSHLIEGDHFFFRTPAGQRALLDILAERCASLAASRR
jgi:medium-chain acyl-[acyl-carrier-protein] hydrolase